MSVDKESTKMENLFLALADRTRLRLLNLMRDDETCVCWLTEVLGESQPKISRHLAYLRNAGIVSARRQGKWIYYKIEFPADKSAAGILENTLEWLDSQENMRLEYKKLFNIRYDAETALKDRESELYISVETDIKNNRREQLETFLL